MNAAKDDNIEGEKNVVDFKIKEITKEHHTDKFEIAKEFLIVRRGQEFRIDIKFSQVYDILNDEIHLVFRFGEKPFPSKYTHVDLIPSPTRNKPNDWQAKILDSASFPNTMILDINTPPTCPVGKWKLSFYVKTSGDAEGVPRTFDQNRHMYILFNPWCKDDQVYMPDESLLKEYVLNDKGIIFTGSQFNVHAKKWNFGQFRDKVLDCCLYLLDKDKSLNRGDPVMVSRKISALVNQTTDGVLVGNWSHHYKDGTNPSKWAGSHKILTTYYQTHSPVKYGQCWVFSGLVTTICRALGIPARSVTNFASAHDRHKSVTIYSCINEDGEPLADPNNDSVWNYHVWNDVWMSRLDMPEEFKQYKIAGWQALDATPQEISDGTYCTGPMPLKAIKNGDLTVPYDGLFVFAEVNADKETYMRRNNGQLVLIETETSAIGKHISTFNPILRYDGWKRVKREDITDQYKFQEGSPEERNAMRKAGGERAAKPMAEKEIAIFVRYKPVLVGENLIVKVQMSNKGKEKRTVTGKLSLASTTYKGKHHMVIGHTTLKYTVIEPETVNKPVKITYTAHEYLDKFQNIDHFNFRLFGFIMAENKEMCAVHEISGRFMKPDLTVEVLSTLPPIVGNVYRVKVSLDNPLNKSLTSCKLSLDGHIKEHEDITLAEVVAKGEVSKNIEIWPTSVGKTEIVIKFTSIELTDIEGHIKMYVFE